MRTNQIQKNDIKQKTNNKANILETNCAKTVIADFCNPWQIWVIKLNQKFIQINRISSTTDK